MTRCLMCISQITHGLKIAAHPQPSTSNHSPLKKISNSKDGSVKGKYASTHRHCTARCTSHFKLVPARFGFPEHVALDLSTTTHWSSVFNYDKCDVLL